MDHVFKAEPIKIRVTHLAYLRSAENFYDAEATFESKDGEFRLVSYFLLCRSIEFSLKSFLIFKNVSRDDLKYTYGHSLPKLLNKCNEYTDHSFLSSSNLVETLTKIDGYGDTELYFDVVKSATGGYNGLPGLGSIRNIANEFIQNLKNYYITLGEPVIKS